MSSRFHKRSSRANSSPRWTCCKCSAFNPRGRHTCDGILPFHDVYDRACNHWRCPGCLSSNNENSARPDGRSAPAPPPPPRPRSPRPPPPTAVYTASSFPPPEPAASQIPQQNPLLSHYSSPHNALPHTPSSRFSYTAAYLQSAASRPNSITFAEAFPAPTSAPVTDPTAALGNLRLDYSAGGCYHHHYHHDYDEHEGEEGLNDEQSLALQLPRQRNGPRDGVTKRSRNGKDRDTVRYHNYGNSNLGDEVRKGKEGNTETEIETEMEAERRRREKGKGKETDFGPSQYQYQYQYQPQFQHPVGYRPVTVEDALEDEHAGCYYRGDDEMEEEW
ncbi:uncharacterized protein B0T15DRAFT_500609 [Chaetomium strumarium]|uniref:Uncharacterized protein n=1 Tax=Chaetomium strumarium TaxID=1170767 RepID=A0AAJ0GZ62_9PEZI|nr:hypothetical protein B0T15DRAFT_500609 [Chaetomium strumarium]